MLKNIIITFMLFALIPYDGKLFSEDLPDDFIPETKEIVYDEFMLDHLTVYNPVPE
jgi:hypothetical protein